MNKLFTKIVGVCLGLTMAIGVGVAIGSKETTPVHATAGDTALSTSFSTSAEYFLFAYNNSSKKNYYLTGLTNGSSDLGKNSNWGVVSESNTSALRFTLTGTQATGTNSASVKAKTSLGGTDCWLAPLSTGKFKLNTSETSITLTSEGKINNPSSSTYYCRLNGTSGFRWYSSETGFLAYFMEAPAAKTLSSITLSGTYPTTFYTGETFRHTGMTVTAIYSDDSKADVTSSANFSGYNMSTAGNQTVTVSYTEGGTTKTTTYSITVAVAPTAESAEVINDMTTKTYVEGTAYDVTGLTLRITYDNDDTRDFDFAEDLTKDTDYILDHDNAVLGDTSLDITGKYLGCEFDFTVTGITVTAAPKIVTYTISGTNANPTITPSGLVPTGTTAKWSNTYTGSNIGQDTAGNSQTLTISSFSKTTIITGITLYMKSNSSAGSGNLSYSADSGSDEFLVGSSSDSAIGFNSWGDNSSFGTSYRNVLIDDDLKIEVSTSFSLKIRCVTNNSLYCTAFTINYEYAPASVTASKTTVTLAADGVSNESITLYSHNLDGTVTFAATSQNTTALPQANLSISGSTLTITAGSTANAGVSVQVTASNGTTTTNPLTITVVLTVVRNITGLTITTEPTKTFKQGTTWNITGLVASATFDAGESPVAYSAAFGNLNDLDFEIDGVAATPGTTVLNTVGTFEVTVSLEVGNNVEFDTYNITVNAPTYYVKATSMSEIWDGQQILIADSNGTKAASTYASGNNVPSVALDFDTDNNRIDVDDASAATVYTIGRISVTIDDEATTVYTIYGGGYYLYAAGTANTGSNYLKGKTTLDKSCYWYISIDTGVLSVTSVNNSYVPHMQFNNNFACYHAASYTAVDFYVLDSDTTGASAAASFVDNYMHMDSDVSGQCIDYYPIAKKVWNAMETNDRSKVAANHAAAYQRLHDWATYHGDSLASNTSPLASARINPLFVATIGSVNTVTIIIVVSLVSITAIGGFFFLRKRKEY